MRIGWFTDVPPLVWVSEPVYIRGAGTAYSSVEPEFIPCCKWSSCCSIFSFLCIILLIIIVLVFFWPLYCLTFFELRLLITLWVSSNFSISFTLIHLKILKYSAAEKLGIISTMRISTWLEIRERSINLFLFQMALRRMKILICLK